jgi:hypothetical protein
MYLASNGANGSITIEGEHMRESDWVKELPAAITVCDRSGIIMAMNDRACATFAAEG